MTQTDRIAISHHTSNMLNARYALDSPISPDRRIALEQLITDSNNAIDAIYRQTERKA